MYLDLRKVPAKVKLGKRTFIINEVGDDDMDVFRLNWSTSALAVIGVHCNPASRRPPMHFLLHKALESSAILCTVPQIHLYFRVHSKKAPHRTWTRGWGQSYNRLDCSPRCMKDIFLPPRSQLFDKIRHDMIKLRFFGCISSFFWPDEYFAKHSDWQILHVPLTGVSLWEKDFCLSKRCQSHTHISKLFLIYCDNQPPVGNAPWNCISAQKWQREKKRKPYISHLWAKHGRSFTEESLADRFSCKPLPQLQLPQVAFFRILSCLCARPFPPKCSLISSGLLCPEMTGSLFGFQRSGASRRTCEFSLWKGKVFPHPGIFSIKIRKIEWKVFNPICPSLF